MVSISQFTPSTYFRKEPLLDFNVYTQPAHREELEALAQNVQNLIIMDKGTFPNDPDCGVGIGSYLFEFMDATTISAIRSEIERQIGKYITSGSVVTTVTVEPLTLPIANTNTLSVKVSMSSSEVATSTTLEKTGADTISMAYSFLGNTTNNKIISRLNL